MINKSPLFLMIVSCYLFPMEQPFSNNPNNPISLCFETCRAVEELISAIQQCENPWANYLKPINPWAAKPYTEQGIIIRCFDKAPAVLITPQGTFKFGVPIGNFETFFERLKKKFPHIEKMSETYMYVTANKSGTSIPFPQIIKNKGTVLRYQKTVNTAQ